MKTEPSAWIVTSLPGRDVDPGIGENRCSPARSGSWRSRSIRARSIGRRRTELADPPGRIIRGAKESASELFAASGSTELVQMLRIWPRSVPFAAGTSARIGACFPGFFDPLRQFARIRPYVGTGTPVRIVRRGDLRAAIKTGPGGMEEPAVTGLTHVRNAARLSVLPLLTAVRTARPIADQLCARSLWHRPETKFAREGIAAGQSTRPT